MARMDRREFVRRSLQVAAVSSAVGGVPLLDLLSFPARAAEGGGAKPVVVKEVVAFSCGVLFEQKSILGRLLEIQGDHCGSAPVSAVA